MRLMSDPQPAIEWFCTGGSVCIGVEDVERPDADAVPDIRLRTIAKTARPARVPVARGDA